MAFQHFPLLGKQFLIAIENSSDPLHKLAYADWLEEQTSMVLQAHQLAYAYRWAAHRRKHPGRTENLWFWRCLSYPGTTMKDLGEEFILPWAVYQYVYGGSTIEFRAISLHAAFQSLANALARLKKDLSLDGLGIE